MAGKMVRVSEWAAERLKALAEADDRTVVSVIDRLLAREAPGNASPEYRAAVDAHQNATLPALPKLPDVEMTCRTCEHSERLHLDGKACQRMGCMCRRFRA